MTYLRRTTLATASLPTPPPSQKKVQHRTATGKDPDLMAGYKVETKAEVEPTNNAVINTSIISGFKETNE